MCYFICEHRFNEFFGAGCNSLPAVKVRDPRKWLTWCNSKTDSIVWMVEDTKVFFVFFRPREDFSWGFSFWKSLSESKGGKKMKKWNVQTIVLTAMLAGLAGALMSLEFSLPMMPPFYKIDFSDVPSIIALFSLGPVSATLVEVIKLVVKVVTVGTNTAYVGELANLLGIVLFVLPTWFVYKKMNKTRKAVIVSLIVGILIRTVFACFCNACITLPLYAKAMGMPLDSVVQMVGSVNPSIKDLTSFIALATIPFNLIKISANYIIGYFLMERLAAIRPSFKFIYEAK